MKCIKKSSTRFCSGKEFLIVVCEDGSVLFDGYDINYDFAFEAMGGTESAEAKLYRAIERDPVGFVVEFCGLPSSVFPPFLLKILQAAVPTIREFSNETADLIDGVTHNALRDPGDKALVQRQLYNFIATLYSRKSNVSNERRGYSTGQADVEFVKAGSMNIQHILECTEDALRHASGVRSAKTTPVQIIEELVHAHDVLTILGRIRVEVPMLRAKAEALRGLGYRPPFFDIDHGFARALRVAKGETCYTSYEEDIVREKLKETACHLKCLFGEIAKHAPHLLEEVAS